MAFTCPPGLVNGLNRQTLQFRQRDLEPLGRDPQEGIQVPHGLHSLWIGELRVVDGDRDGDHTHELPAVVPAGFSPLGGMERASRFHQRGIAFQQRDSGLLDELFDLDLKHVDAARLDARPITERQSFLAGHQPLLLVHRFDDLADRCRQIRVVVQAQHPSPLDQLVQCGVVVSHGVRQPVWL